MRHRHTIALSVALLAALPSAASAAVRTAHRYTSSIQVGMLSSEGGYPGLNGTAVLSGPVKLNTLGDGALVDHVKIVGHPTDAIFTLAGTEVAYLSGGTVRSSYTGWALLRPDGTLSLRISGHATGGTGAYRGARGTYEFTGSTPAGSTITVGGSTGTITY